jgi:hypothetical protein
MLDRAGVAVAQPVRFLGDRQRFRLIVARALVGVIDGWKELHTELHVVLRSLREIEFRWDVGNSRILRPGGQSIDRAFDSTI